MQARKPYDIEDIETYKATIPDDTYVIFFTEPNFFALGTEKLENHPYQKSTEHVFKIFRDVF